MTEAPCTCFHCTEHRAKGMHSEEALAMMGRMFLCSTCGNKRCPRAADHDNPCSGSNEPGQPGSLYEDAPILSDPEMAGRILKTPSVPSRFEIKDLPAVADAWTPKDPWAMVNILRAEEGDSVTILCDNPDSRTPEENCAVECNGPWTDWGDKRFMGVTVEEALRKAVAAYEEYSAATRCKPT